MKNETALGIAAIVLAIPGFALLFVDGYVALGIVALLLVALIFYVKWRLELPHFTIKSVDKDLVFTDGVGKKAKLTRRQVAVANHPGITEFWCRNIGADGRIDNILIDGQKPHQEKGTGGDREVCKRFDRPLKSGEEFITVLSYELIDSFESRREGLIHVVEGKTKKLKLCITFPSERKVTEYRAILRYGGEEHSEISGLTLAQNQLQIEIKKPKFGAQYLVEWVW